MLVKKNGGDHATALKALHSKQSMVTQSSSSTNQRIYELQGIQNQKQLESVLHDRRNVATVNAYKPLQPVLGMTETNLQKQQQKQSVLTQNAMKEAYSQNQNVFLLNKLSKQQKDQHPSSSVTSKDQMRSRQALEEEHVRRKFDDATALRDSLQERIMLNSRDGLNQSANNFTRARDDPRKAKLPKGIISDHFNIAREDHNTLLLTPLSHHSMNIAQEAHNSSKNGIAFAASEDALSRGGVNNSALIQKNRTT